MRANEISVVTVSKLGNSSGEWLRTEDTPVTEPETAMRALNLYGSDSRVKVVYRANFRWTSPSLICTGTANALENQATTYPVTCLGHVRVLYILNNRNDVGKYDL